MQIQVDTLTFAHNNFSYKISQLIKTFTVKTRYTERKLNSNEKNVICRGVKQMRQLLENYKKYKNSIKWKMVNLN